ncbi:MAG: SET domain-containing protein-lysine N-methyltransferase [Gemmatimonadetes bacterium]|nr:MAG: SET domain-containing protein-lysine N-methyltransferase [Gemmatimonadota bacterium]
MARRTVKKQLPLDQPFVVRKSRIAGKGAFANRTIKKGERLIEYLGERLTHAQSDARYDDHAGGAHHTFLFNANPSTVIDAYVGGNDARFINHSCAPNCESEIERGRVFVDAIKRIRKGGELFYDYAYGRDGTETPEDETGLYGCCCGSRNCRGSILEEVTEVKKARLEAGARRRGAQEERAAARTANKTKAKKKSKSKKNTTKTKKRR